MGFCASHAKLRDSSDPLERDPTNCYPSAHCGGGGIGIRRGFGTLEHHSVMRVQVPFTAVSSGAIMADPTANPSGHDFSHLEDIPSCPPRSASSREGTFYAFHDSAPPDESDFQTAAQRGTHRTGDECERNANSIWSDLEALQKRISQLRRKHPHRYNFVSSGNITNDHGVFKDAADPHCTFWVCGKHSMRDIFTTQVS